MNKFIDNALVVVAVLFLLGFVGLAVLLLVFHPVAVIVGSSLAWLFLLGVKVRGSNPNSSWSRD